MKITKFAVDRPVATSMLFLALVFTGILAYLGMGVNILPQSEMPSIMVTTLLPGANSDEISKNVTEKIEKEVSSIGDIKRVVSYSMNNVSSVVIEFNIGKDEDEALNEVREKTEQALGELPGQVERPLIQKIKLNDIPVVSIVLSGNISGKELFDIADNDLKNKLSRINGVTKVDINGGEEREIKILADMRRSMNLGIDLNQVGVAINAANSKISSGRYTNNGVNLSVETGREVTSVKEIENLRISHNGNSIAVKDFATVSDSIKRAESKSTLRNISKDEYYDNVISIDIRKEPNANSVKVAQAIKDALPSFQANLPEGVILSIPFDNSLYTESSVDDAIMNVVLGVLLTGAVLFLFLGSFKTVLIVSISIPVSLIISFTALKQLDVSLNMMTLMSFAVAIGALISNSIVVIENIIRLKNLGLSSKVAAVKGTSEVVVAVIASTGTNLVVFVPMAMMSSLIGLYFVEYAIAISVATVSSLFISFTLTPMLASLFLSDDNSKGQFAIWLDKQFERIQSNYRRSLIWLLSKKKRGIILFITMVAIFFSSFGLLNYIGFDFMPKDDAGYLFVESEFPSGTSLERSQQYVNEIESAIMEYNEVAIIKATVGKKGAMSRGDNLVTMELILVPKDQREITSYEFVNILQDRLDLMPGVKSIVTVEGTQQGFPISFLLQSDNTADLKKASIQVEEMLSALDGVSSIEANNQDGDRLIKIIPRLEMLSQIGISPNDLAMTIYSAIEGVEIGVYKERGKEYDIRISYNQSDINDTDKIKSIPIFIDGNRYNVDQLADIEYGVSEAQIYRFNGTTSIEFGIMPDGTIDDMTMTKNIEEILSEANLPKSVNHRWSGSTEDMNASITEILFTLIISITLLYMLLAALLENIWRPLILFTTLPMAMIGVFLVMYVSGVRLNILSMIAIITLLGLAVNDSILLHDYKRQLQTLGRSLRTATIESAVVKLKTVIMTSAAIAIGMLPNALEFGAGVGAAYRTPVALVTIGGIITSTVLTLYVIPALFYMVKEKR